MMRAIDLRGVPSGESKPLRMGEALVCMRGVYIGTIAVNGVEYDKITFPADAQPDDIREIIARFCDCGTL